MVNPIRSFIAIPLTIEIHRNLEACIQAYGLNNRESGFRPVKPENIHLTLKFLGDVEPVRIPVISNQLEKVAKTFSPIKVSVRGLGAFPGWKKHPRVLWVGIQPLQQIQSIFHAVDRITTALGFPPENKPFSPHLTLARVNQQSNNPRFDETIDRMMNIEPEPVFGEMIANEIILYKSLLQPTGPVYTVLSRYAFIG